MMSFVLFLFSTYEKIVYRFIDTKTSTSKPNIMKIIT